MEEILIEFNERLKLNISIVIIITPKLFDIPSIKMWSLSRLVVALINNNSLMDSVGEGEGGTIWENGIETCVISCIK